MLAILKNQIKKRIPVSWQNPFVSAIIKFIDPIDYFIRSFKGLNHLPRYSVRIRSNGMKNQFGGDQFERLGKLLVNLLTKNANTGPSSHILEIGCGCGRTALQFSKIIVDGSYSGMDIDKKSLDDCRQNKFLQKSNFHFYYVDVYNNEYNPEGTTKANQYVFPFENKTFDTIYLISVFTHMLTQDVENYINEIGRILKPGGICMISTFLVNLMDYERGNFRFKYKTEEHYFDNPAMPEVAVAYTIEFFISCFEKAGFIQQGPVLPGLWRNEQPSISKNGFAQDILFLKKIK